MDTNTPHSGGHDGGLSSLNASIGALHLAEQNSSIEPAKTVFGSAGVLLATIRDSGLNERDYFKLGLSCAGVCQALDRGLNGRRTDELSGSLLGAIETLTTTIATIQKEIVEQGKRNSTFQAKNDKKMIADWGRDLDRILLIFHTELSINNHMILLDIHRDVQACQGGTDRQHQSAQPSVLPGELPPPRPRACFGRDELIEKIVVLADTLNPIALIGAGGIGKTFVALAVLHHERIEQRFGGNRRFVRCDQFPASHANFLRQLSKVIGAGVENPEDMVSLRPFLSSRKMIIVLDNAESVLDPQGTDAREIYAMVKELSQFSNICLCVTSRISNVPPHCMRVEIPTLSMEAARNIFHSIYGGGDRSGIIDNLLQRLDFHALSITLLATAASDNMWSFDRLSQEWDEQRTQVLRTDFNESLAAAIESSLTSPTFCKLGPNARDLLGVVAFFPQGIDEKNLDWFFSTIPDRKNIFDKFCALSLTYRSNQFITMLAPLQDYLSPQDPMSSPLLSATKDHYFTRLSVHLDPDRPGFAEARWIKSEDENVEHLLDVLTSIDTNAINVWDACYHFMEHLYWQKPRQTVLRSKIEGLPDGHPSKVKCLFKLSWLYGSVGNDAEEKRLLGHTLTLGREQGDDLWVALTLRSLSRVNWILRQPREGIPQAEEALELFKRLEDPLEQANCLQSLARLLLDDDQLDAAQDAVSRKLELLPEEGQEFQLIESHRVLGGIYRSKGEREKTIHHFKAALKIASAFNWQDELFSIHYELAQAFRDEDKFEDSNAHIKQAKLHTADNAYHLGLGGEIQSRIWYRQCRLEEARGEALGALEVFERLGAMADVERCRELCQSIERAIESRSISSESGSSGEHLSSQKWCYF
ncbi:hypothetical protein BJ322DRAFT_1164340 [Thelephora terrestris]|uniref:AAA+ ATPase domain-containing protein n=1 Tax=Thelephora terrestris TaxID=56493 RepID=A0A9P6H6H7_9AGAM|nr:hypothetical protein BJ322DRAFT_1164340 [Thelephora terrestris]